MAGDVAPGLLRDYFGFLGWKGFDPAVWAGQLYKPLGTAGKLPAQSAQLKAIPYHLWGNRGPNAMRVWIPRNMP